ncbi:MAG TPA: hypothetical protein VGI45_08350 [Terracidiphilus sp.]|jgi:hypothetical protein
MRDLQNDGFSPDEFVRIERRRLTSDQAFQFECELIAQYRRNGALLFNKERGNCEPVRRYENKWMPDPRFGEMPRRRPPLTGNEETMTENDFKSKALRTEDQTSVTYDLRPFADQQATAAAWYLGWLSFRLSARLLVTPTKAAVLLVDTRFEITAQFRRFLRKLKSANIAVEIRYLS